ncbi:MAG: amylo-alpha-1,6-glucosidase [Armatimonadota bacterium]|nr:amylo-alpha-1,6-glucosidase [Armatimonadota bacterium]
MSSSHTPLKRPHGASFVLPGTLVDFQPIQKFELPKSGLSLTRACKHGQFYAVIGHRCALLGKEAGPFEVWGHPFKYAFNCKLTFEKGGKTFQTSDLCSKIDVTPEATFFNYEGKGIKIREIIITPIKQPGVAILLDIQEGTPLKIIFSFQSDLKLMWPADWQARQPDYALDEATGAWAIISGAEEHTVLIGAPGARACSLGIHDENRYIAIDVSAEEAATSFVPLVISGDVGGVNQARETFIEIGQNIPKIAAENASYYRNLIETTLTIETPDAEINEAFTWAKVGLDKCFMETPSIGAGYVAGWNTSNDSGRPGFGWYFGRDSVWESLAACLYGQYEKVRRNLDLLAKHQILFGENRGKVYHELSAAHDFCFDKNYAYVAGDSTPLFVICMAAFLRWTGDLDYIKMNWGRIRYAMDWCYRMDIDRDLLIDNPPAGHQWYDYGEKNMVDLVAIWAHALDQAAWMGRLLNDSDAERWAADASKVRLILNSDFWNTKRGYIYDRKLPDETFCQLTTANPAVPLLWGLVQPEKAQRTINVLFSPAMYTPWGTRTNSNQDDIYNPWGYHEGTVWPLVTGWASLAAYENHRPEEGLRALKANAELTKDFSLGYIPEILCGDERVAGGCPHQGWSEAMIIMPLAKGMLGLDANILEGTIRFGPHLPQEWDKVRVRNFRAGNNTFDISFEKTEDLISTVVRRTSGFRHLSLHFNPAIQKDANVKLVTVNGTVLPEAEWNTRTTATDKHIELVLPIGDMLEIAITF